VGTTRFPYFTTALNKTIQYRWADVTNGTNQIAGQAITITAADQYGLEMTDNVALSNSATPTFNVSGATASTQVPAFTLSGVVSGGRTGATNTVFTKSGNGTLVLGNANNTFGGGGSIIDLTGGYLAAGSDGALGNSANVVRLSTNSATQGFRATGTFATNRTILLNAASSSIEVTAGNTLTLNSASGCPRPRTPYSRTTAGRWL